MQVEEARRLAHARGIEMRPGDPTVELDGLFDQVDVADIIHACLDETHPPAQRPDRKHDWQAYQLWEIEREAIRAEIFDAFDAGTRARPFKAKELVCAI